MRSSLLLFVVTASSIGCASSTRRFPLRAAVWTDRDLTPVAAGCRRDEKDPKKTVCVPATYDSPLLWDAADNSLFRPMAWFFAVDPAGDARNVNSLDEVPDSSWFMNRIGRHAMSAEEVGRGPCWRPLDPSATDGSWVIDQGKPNGANPGFRIDVEGLGKFMLKADTPDQPERATGADAIAVRFYWAAGYYVPCDSVVYFKPSLLKIKPGLTVTDNSGETKPFDQKALADVLAKASRRGDLVRMEASQWLPGKTLGPFTYEGTRADDPHDVIPHEDRRDLRGAKLIAAWLNHFDSREQNTMSAWIPSDKEHEDRSLGYVRHYYIDLGDCFGSEWEWDEISRRLGHSYYFDPDDVLEDWLTLGLVEWPWDVAHRSKRAKIFGYFRTKDFDPATWKGGYPNPAFSRMRERDAAWAARILARFDRGDIEAAVRAGDYTNPEDAGFLEHALAERLERILGRYLTKLSPITDVKIDGDRLCGLDLAGSTGTVRTSELRYRSVAYAGERLTKIAAPGVETRRASIVCASLKHIAADGGARDDAAERYLVVDVFNGVSPGPLRAHLYDLGPKRGFVLAGLERPDDGAAPH